MKKEIQNIRIPVIIIYFLCIVLSMVYAEYSGGTGTLEDPYLIGSVEDWQNLVDTPDHWSLHFKLIQDIDFQGANITRIGFGTTIFRGSINGNGHVIRNAVISQETEAFVGLIGTMQTPAVISNIGLENISVTGSRWVGGLVANNLAGTISNVYVTGTVTSVSTANSSHAGGLAALNSGLISGCSSSADVSGMCHIVGGLVAVNTGTIEYSHASGEVLLMGSGGGHLGGGLVAQNDRGTIIGSFATGDVTDSSGQGLFIGGFVGENSGAAALIDRCYATGTVSSVSAVGGFAGRNFLGSITDSYSLGNVHRNSGTFHSLGGFIGDNSAGRIVRCYSIGAVIYDNADNPTGVGFCSGYSGGSNFEMAGNFWDVENSGQTSSPCSAQGKTTGEMQDKETYITEEPVWDFQDTWNILSFVNQGYPYLVGVTRGAPIDLPLFEDFSDAEGYAHGDWKLRGEADFFDTEQADGTTGRVVRLTREEMDQLGMVLFDHLISSADGFQIELDYYMDSSAGGAGFAFFLVDGLTENITPGAGGSSLGYAPSADHEGVPHAYLGIGFDRSGDFLHSSDTVGLRDTPGSMANTISLGGSGNEFEGYKYIDHENFIPLAGGWRKVRISLETGSADEVLLSLFISTNNGLSWYPVFDRFRVDNAADQAPLPNSFKFGFTATTEEERNNNHYIDNIYVRYPVDIVITEESPDGNYESGDTVSYSFTIENSAGSYGKGNAAEGDLSHDATALMDDVTWSYSGALSGSGSGAIIDYPLSLDPGEYVTFTVSGVIQEGFSPADGREILPVSFELPEKLGTVDPRSAAIIIEGYVYVSNWEELQEALDNDAVTSIALMADIDVPVDAAEDPEHFGRLYLLRSMLLDGRSHQLEFLHGELFIGSPLSSPLKEVQIRDITIKAHNPTLQPRERVYGIFVYRGGLLAENITIDLKWTEQPDEASPAGLGTHYGASPGNHPNLSWMVEAEISNSEITVLSDSLAPYGCYAGAGSKLTVTGTSFEVVHSNNNPSVIESAFGAENILPETYEHTEGVEHLFPSLNLEDNWGEEVFYTIVIHCRDIESDRNEAREMIWTAVNNNPLLPPYGLIMPGFEEYPFRVTYDPNTADDGEPPVDESIYQHDAVVTVTGNPGTLAKTGHIFAGWNTSADGKGMTFQEGETFVIGEQSITLYARWIDAEADEEITSAILEGWIPVATAGELSQIEKEEGKTFGSGTPWEGIYIGGMAEYYLQVADIDLNGENFRPVGYGAGNEYTVFSGIYNGLDHSIFNGSIAFEDDSYIALFARSEGVIENLTLKDIVVEANDYAGTLTGYQKNGMISRVSVHGTGSVQGNNHTGGLAGYISDSSVTEVCVLADVSGNDYIGGLSGTVQNTLISQSCARGNVQGRNYVGGLAGQVKADAVLDTVFALGDAEGNEKLGGLAGALQSSEISHAYARGSVDGINNVGGLVGYLEDSILLQGYSAGGVTSKGQDRGGLVGSVSSSGNPSIVQSYYDSNTAGQNDDDGRGEPRSTVQMTEGYNDSTIEGQEVYTGWSRTIWRFCHSTEYPRFQWEAFTLQDLPVGTRVIDLSAEWEYRDGPDYTGTVVDNRPVYWIIAAQDHFGEGSTLLMSEDLVAKYRFDESNAQSWETSDIRNWLREDFYNHLSQNFQDYLEIVTTYTAAGHPDGSANAAELDDETVMLLSANELGLEPPLENDGSHVEYFTDNEIRKAAGPHDGSFTDNTVYWTRSPSVDDQLWLYAVDENGALFHGDASTSSDSDLYVRPAVNLSSHAAVFGLFGRGKVEYFTLFETVTASVLYDDNGADSGDVPINDTQYVPGEIVVIMGNPGNLEKEGYVLAGWNTRGDGKGTMYREDDTLIMGEEDVTLYAVWWPEGIITERILDGWIPVASADEIKQIEDDEDNVFGEGTYWEGNYYGGMNKKYIQVQDIELGIFEPVGYGALFGYKCFSGQYDGQEFSIYDGTIHYPDDSSIGLFASLNGAGVINVALDNVNVTGNDLTGGLAGMHQGGYIYNSSTTGTVTGNMYVGGLFGNTYSGAIINNCWTMGNISGTGNYIGGLAGSSGDGVIIVHSFALGNVSGADNVGGLVGEAVCDSEIIISGCYAAGRVQGQNNVGGLAGFVRNGYIENAYAEGKVTAPRNDGGVGGLLGNLENGYVINSYAVGEISSPGEGGGLIGINDFGGYVTNSFWDMQSTGKNLSDGGEGKTTQQMKSYKTFAEAGWNFPLIWRIDESEELPDNEGYPSLAMQNLTHRILLDEWLYDYEYRRSFFVHNNTSTEMEHYQVELILYHGEGEDSDTELYLHNSAKGDLRDIRFTSGDGVTLLNHYIASNNEDYSRVWVKLEHLPANSNIPLCLYYGNSDALCSSSFTDTFTALINGNFESGDFTGWETLDAYENWGRKGIYTAEISSEGAPEGNYWAYLRAHGGDTQLSGKTQDVSHLNIHSTDRVRFMLYSDAILEPPAGTWPHSVISQARVIFRYTNGEDSRRIDFHQGWDHNTLKEEIPQQIFAGIHPLFKMDEELLNPDNGYYLYQVEIMARHKYSQAATYWDTLGFANFIGKYSVAFSGSSSPETRKEQEPLVFEPVSPRVYGTANILTASGGSGTGDFSFLVLDGPGQIINENELLITAGSGTIEIQVTREQDNEYRPAYAIGFVEALPATLHVINATALDKVYDGTTNALIKDAELDGIVEDDDVFLQDHTQGNFAHEGPGRDIPVTTAMTLDGVHSEHYELIQPDYLEAHIFAPVNADFTAAPTSGEAPLQVTFSDLSVGDIETWEWDLGDGTLSTISNPVHEYSTPGTYTVSLTVSSPDISDTIIRQNYIQVFEQDSAEYDAEITDWSLPDRIPLNRTSTFMIQFRNTGRQPWLLNENIYLGAVGDYDPLAPSHFWRVHPQKDIYHLQEGQYVIELKPEEIGFFTTEWQMLREGFFWFGEIFSQEVEVYLYTNVERELWQLFE